MKKEDDIYYDEDRETKKEKFGIIILAGAVALAWVVYIKLMLF